MFHIHINTNKSSLNYTQKVYNSTDFALFSLHRFFSCMGIYIRRKII